jgi:hypothetical protein
MKIGLVAVCTFAVVVLWAGRSDAAAGAWFGLCTIALTPLAIWLLLRSSSGGKQLPNAVDVETLAWAQSQSSSSRPQGPRRGIPIPGELGKQIGRSLAPWAA